MPSPVVLAVKDPNEVKRYKIDWNVGPNGQPGILASLGSDTITGTPLWIVQAGITKDSASNTTTTTTAVFSGGVHGVDYTITCRIATLGGETLEQSFILPVRNKDDAGGVAPPAETGAILLESGSNTKISALTAGAPALVTDQIVVERSGTNRRLPLSEVMATAVLPLQVVTATYTAAQVKTLKTLPIEVLPAVAGKFYYVFLHTFIKDGATAFVGGTGQALQLQWTASTKINATSMAGVFLDSAAISGRFQVPAQAQLISEAAAEIGGKSLELNLQTADLTGTGSPCTLTVYYYLLDAAA